MTITISDVKRYLLAGGDVDAFSGVLGRVLGNPPLKGMAGLEKTYQMRETEPLTENQAENFLAAIVTRTREHTAILRGASVRGAIAFKEVLQGYCLLEGLTRRAIAKAALTTLPHRISVKQDHPASSEDLVIEIVNEVLYGLTFNKPAGLVSKMAKLSPDDILSALDSLNKSCESHGKDPNPALQDKIAIVPDDRGNYQSYDRTIDNSLTEDEKWQMSYRKAVERMLDELTRKFKNGQISEKEFEQENRRLKDILNAAKQLIHQSSSREMARTMMEFMDARDKQWRRELTHQDVYVYYHVKSTCENKDISPPKRSWYGLKVIIDYLTGRGMLAEVKPESFTLTAEALEMLLEHFVPDICRCGSRRRLYAGRMLMRERTSEVRRFALGDVYRDISIRHTIREIANQRKQLPEISRRDLRVFLRQRSNLPSNIMLCLDSSGSMGFHQKLIYARLIAAGLARAALQRADRVGLVTFDDLGRSVVPLTDNLKEIFRSIVKADAGGNTNVGDGIRCAAELLLREPSRNNKYIVLITDGESTAISQKEYSQLQAANEKDLPEEISMRETRRAMLQGIKTSVIHITDEAEAGKAFVKKVAQAGMGHVQKVSSVEDIKRAAWQEPKSE